LKAVIARQGDRTSNHLRNNGKSLGKFTRLL